MGNETEAPQEFNRGWFLPIAILRFYDQGVLSESDAFLLGKINSLQDPIRGCYASNAWLGRWWRGRHLVNVSKAIRRLEDIGAIRVVFVGDGKQKQRRIFVTFAGDELSRPLSKNAKTPLAKTLSRDIEDKYNRTTLAPSSEGERFLQKATNCLATYLHTKSIKLDNRQLRKAAKQLQWLLLKDLAGDRSRLKHVLQGYVKEYHDQYTPRVHSAYEFRQKFLKIEAWLNRHNPPPPKEEYKVEIIKRTYK